jgi:molybdenum cofactor biosynthesis enzyme MoaA
MNRRGGLCVTEQPSSATVFVSSRCVNRCVFCAAAEARERKGALADEEILEFIGRARRLGAWAICFSGSGEPTLNPRLGEFSSHARAVGFRSISVFTNGHGITRGSLQSLLRCGVDSFLLSIHGTVPVHDRVVGRSGSYAEAMRALRLMALSGARVVANTCVTRPAAQALGELVDIVRAVGPARHRLAFPEWGGAALANRDLLVRYDEFRTAVERACGSRGSGVEVENVPDCLAPQGVEIKRAHGQIAYRDPVFDAVLDQGLNLSHNTLLPECELAWISTDNLSPKLSA